MWWNKKLNKNLQPKLVYGVLNQINLLKVQKNDKWIRYKRIGFPNSLSSKKDSGLVVSWSLVKKIGESLGLVKLRLARKLQSLLGVVDYVI